MAFNGKFGRKLEDDTAQSFQLECCVQGGKRELVLGVDDELLKNKSRSIPRADVAEVTVQCLTLTEASNRYGAGPIHTHTYA